MPAARQTPLLFYVAATLAGAALPLAFAPFGFWLAAPLSAGILCFLLTGTAPRTAFRLAWWFGVGFYGIGTSWIYVSIHTYGAASTPLAILLTGLFTLGMALLFALPFILCGYLDLSRLRGILLGFPAVWVLGEWLRGWFLTGFPWLYLGYAPLDTWLAGWAPVTGVLGMSLGVAVTGAALAALLNRANALAASALAVSVIWMGGWLLHDRPWTEPGTAILSVALVQPAQSLAMKWDGSADAAILANFTATNRTLTRQDLVIWPETAIPHFRHEVQPFLDREDAWARKQGMGLLLGLPIAASEDVYYNSFIGLGTAAGTYSKRRLVPFGEYVPLEPWLRGMIAFFDLPMSNFNRAPEDQPPITLGALRIAAAICYEIVYPNLVATSARDANLLVTVSNDTWFGASIGPHQHLQMARLRAIETGKPVLRATNDGITAAVDSRGRVTASLPQFAPGILRTSVLPRTGSTPFSTHGSTPVVLFCLVLLAGALAPWQRRGALR
ncbi:MAG: apolipoprotein N-acyltransferase [Gammaproteobacteria bacterium]|nr:apolipoprotein N-acyltransferase [Gammaproteobacteria bacterium]